MADHSVEIPNRAAFKASEVCEIAKIPPYVLRSWEKEFPRLGAAARPGGPRIYRRSDIEQILRIKQLVFAEGLTLAGARRRIEGDQPEEDVLPLEVPAAVTEDVRVKVTRVKRELESLLEMLSHPAAAASAARSVDGVSADPAAAPSAPAPSDRADEEALPLLNGVLDAPPKPRKTRRPSKDGREAKVGPGDAASNVE